MHGHHPQLERQVRALKQRFAQQRCLVAAHPALVVHLTAAPGPQTNVLSAAHTAEPARPVSLVHCSVAIAVRAIPLYERRQRSPTPEPHPLHHHYCFPVQKLVSVYAATV